MDEQMKLVISPALKPFVQNCGELMPGEFDYAKYFVDLPEHLGVIPINGKMFNQPCHVYVDDSLIPGEFKLVYRQITCSGTLTL